MSNDDKKYEKLSARMLRISEAAQLLSVHPNTIRAWHNLGLLKAYRVGRRGDRRFRLEDIEKFLKTGLPRDA